MDVTANRHGARRGVTPDNIDTAFPPLSSKNAALDARKRVHTESVPTNSKRARVSPEPTNDKDASGDKNASRKSKRGKATPRQSLPVSVGRNPNYVPKPTSSNGLATAVTSAPQPRKTVAFEESFLRKTDTPDKVTARTDRGAASTGLASLFFNVDVNMEGDDTDKENNESHYDGDTTDDGAMGSQRSSQWTPRTSPEYTPECTTEEDSEEDDSHSSTAESERTSHAYSWAKDDCSCRSCRWKALEVEPGSDWEDITGVPPTTATGVKRSRYHAFSPPVLVSEPSPATSSTLEETSSFPAKVHKDVGATSMDVDEDVNNSVDNRDKTAVDETVNAQKEVSEGTNPAEEAHASTTTVDKGKGKATEPSPVDSAHTDKDKDKATETAVADPVNTNDDQNKAVKGSATGLKQLPAPTAQTAKDDKDTTPAVVATHEPAAPGMSKDMMQLLTALVQQECAKAIPKAPGIEALTEQMTRVHDMVHDTLHMVADSVVDMADLRHKFKTMKQSLADVQGVTDVVNDKLDDLSMDVARLKKRGRRLSNETAQSAKADDTEVKPDISQQLKHLDNAVLGIEAKLSAIGMFLTGEVVRDVASVEENGLKQLFDRVYHGIEFNSEVLATIDGHVDELVRTADSIHLKVEEIDNEVGFEEAEGKSSIHGRLASIEGRLEANFKY